MRIDGLLISFSLYIRAIIPKTLSLTALENLIARNAFTRENSSKCMHYRKLLPEEM